MSLYLRILVPFDFSDSSTAALRHATRLAISSGAELILLHVLADRHHDPGVLEDLRADAIQRLELAVPADELLQLRTRFIVNTGNPSKEILELARESSVDLIVMGTRGRSGILHLALGSVAETVLRNAPCPVLTVRSEEAMSATAVATTGKPVSADELEASPVVDLLHRAIGLRATDIHFDPVSDEEFMVRFRIDGKLEEYCRLDHFVGVRQVQQLKILANLDVADPFRPKEGTLRAMATLPEVEIRITTSPVPDGEAVALRLASRTNLSLPLENLGLAERPRREVDELLNRGEGMILVTGRTGSGKTTTVYSLLSKLATGKRNIASIEDPVEYSVPFVRQMQVDERHNLTTASGLKTILRMDPDVVFVGEIRDQDTAEIAMRAASSGRIVLSTLHTRDVAATITAIRDLHINARSVSANLSGIINQRLIRRICPNCREVCVPTDAEKSVFLAEGITPPATLYRPAGCDKCRRRGFSGRIGIYEVATMNPVIAEAVEQEISEASLRGLLRQHGVTSLHHDALLKVAEGITSLQEVQDMSWA